MKENFFIPTETRNTRTQNLDKAGAAGIIKLINREDSLAVAAVKAASKPVEKAIKETAKRFLKGGKIIFTGAGTSGRLGVIEASECPPTFSTGPGRIIGIIAGGAGAIFKAKEGAEDDADLGAKDMLKHVKKGDSVFGIAASGRTPYVLGALKAAKKAGAYTSFITCNDKTDKKAADNIIYLPTGPEALQGSTRMKAGSATKMALNIITTGAMVLCGKVYKNYMVDVDPGNIKLLARARRLVCNIAGVDEAAAAKFLDATGYKVKPAIVMARLKISKTKAEALLKKHKGFLRKVIG
jgi:N-acetylmuramic acid 6-phosphate etherase